MSRSILQVVSDCQESHDVAGSFVKCLVDAIYNRTFPSTHNRIEVHVKNFIFNVIRAIYIGVEKANTRSHGTTDNMLVINRFMEAINKSFPLNTTDRSEPSEILLYIEGAIRNDKNKTLGMNEADLSISKTISCTARCEYVLGPKKPITYKIKIGLNTYFKSRDGQYKVLDFPHQMDNNEYSSIINSIFKILDTCFPENENNGIDIDNNQLLATLQTAITRIGSGTQLNGLRIFINAVRGRDSANVREAIHMVSNIDNYNKLCSDITNPIAGILSTKKAEIIEHILNGTGNFNDIILLNTQQDIDSWFESSELKNNIITIFKDLAGSSKLQIHNIDKLLKSIIDDDTIDVSDILDALRKLNNFNPNTNKTIDTAISKYSEIQSFNDVPITFSQMYNKLENLDTNNLHPPTTIHKYMHALVQIHKDNNLPPINNNTKIEKYSEFINILKTYISEHIKSLNKSIADSQLSINELTRENSENSEKIEQLNEEMHRLAAIIAARDKTITDMTNMDKNKIQCDDEKMIRLEGILRIGTNIPNDRQIRWDNILKIAQNKIDTLSAISMLLKYGNLPFLNSDISLLKNAINTNESNATASISTLIGTIETKLSKYINDIHSEWEKILNFLGTLGVDDNNLESTHLSIVSKINDAKNTGNFENINTLTNQYMERCKKYVSDRDATLKTFRDIFADFGDNSKSITDIINHIRENAKNSNADDNDEKIMLGAADALERILESKTSLVKSALYNDIAVPN
jgi:hypothetical protein